MTPKEFFIYVDAFNKRKEEKQKESLTLAYYNAMWTVQWLGKKSQQPKPLKKILDSIFKEKKPMTDEEMLKQAKVLNKMFGGKETNK